MTDKHTDEIDLVELLARFVRVLWRHAVLIVGCVVVALGLSVWIGLAKPKVYESRMMIYSDILTESYCDQLAENLSALIKDENYDLLSKRLGMSPEQASKLRRVQIEGTLEGQVSEAERNFVVVVVRTVDNSILPDLQEGIMQYISEKDFVKVRTEEKKRFYKELIARVGEEIEKLETVKQRISAGEFRQVSGMVMMNPADIYRQTVELFKEKLTLEEELRLVNSVQLVEGFSPVKRHVSPKLSLLVSGGLLLGLVFAFLILGLRYVIMIARGNE